MPRFNTALVTGASSGIGTAYCKALAKEQCNLVITARDNTKLTAIAKELAADYNIKVYVIAQDLSNPKAPELIYDFTQKNNLSIDLLINNAGHGDNNDFTTATLATHNNMIAAMLSSTVALCHLYLPNMLSNKHGHIINVASTAGLIGFAVKGKFARSLYRPIKTFIVSFTQQLANTYRSEGIKLQCLCPGLTITEFHNRIGEKDLYTSIPKIFWMSAANVVSYSLKHASSKSLRPRIPGIINKILVFIYKICNILL
tara:strand:+ start:1346 stop:2116 length:771 start_codon:yes stop_codon:yes gene_type:complete